MPWTVRGLALALTLPMLANCTQQTAAPRGAAPSAGPAPALAALPSGSGCSAEITRFRAVLDNDLQVGHVDRSVHGRASSDLGSASQACAAGREAEARVQLRATRARYGYP